VAVFRRRDEGGATAVEFALVMLPLLYLVFGIIQYGLYFYARESGTHAVGDAVRRLSVGDCQNETELKNFIHARLGSASTTAAADIDTDSLVYKKADGTASAAPGVIGGSVQLTATFSAINMNFPFIPVPNDGEIDATVFGRIEDVSPVAGGCT
jgi:Flp pilus assembly protein TadG